MSVVYETGTPSTILDLVQKLSTFARGLSTPWTEDELDLGNNRCTLHNGSCYVSFAWDASPSTDLGLYQSLGFTPGNAVYNHPNDSGNGDSTPGIINTGRRVNFGAASGFVAYHFFGESTGTYIHVVVEVSSGVYRHFGFGNLVKHGTWTGGEYVYGHHWSPSDLDNPAYASHSFGLDGTNANAEGATIHVEGLPEQGGSEKWGVCAYSSSAGTDRAGQTRRTTPGGARGGFWGYQLSWFPYSSPNAYKPLMPIPVVFYDQSAAPKTWRWLGTWPDVAMVNMSSFSPGQEISVGVGETWMVFPWVRKQYLLTNTQESWNAGIAYRKA